MRIRTQITPSWYHEYYAIGRAKCDPNDIYDESTGRKIAKARAVTKAYKEAYRCATKYFRRQLMYIDSYNRFQLKVSDVINGNQKYLERMLRLNQAKQVMKQKEHHDLKISPKYYRDIESNGKRFEVRFNDRDFKVGDILNLREWAGGEYTGRKITCEVKYILDNPDYCKDGYVIMQIDVISISR
jgi:hypothetical protein